MPEFINQPFFLSFQQIELVKKPVVIVIFIGISFAVGLGVLVGVGGLPTIQLDSAKETVLISAVLPGLVPPSVPEGAVLDMELLCMETDIPLYLEDCRFFMSEVKEWCNDNDEYTKPMCSKSRFTEFFETIDQKIEIVSTNLEVPEIVSSASLQPYIINEKNKVIVIDPIFTGTAYNDNGFYDYWAKKCDESCLNIPICFDCILNLDAIYGKNAKAVLIFEYLNYPIITDYDLAINPNIIFEYDTVIMLHNEYVTREMFDAVTSHPKVMYLYPNAFYNEVFLEGKNIHLINVSHAPQFGWEYENTHPFEFDRDCKNWKTREIPQGEQLLCYPERRLLEDLSLITYINDFIFSI